MRRAGRMAALALAEMCIRDRQNSDAEGCHRSGGEAGGLRGSRTRWNDRARMKARYKIEKVESV